VAPPVHDNFMVEEPAPAEALDMTFSKTADDVMVSPPIPEGPAFEVATPVGDDDESYQGPEVEPYNPQLDLENYRYPTLELMKKYDNNEPTINMEEQKANKDRINQFHQGNGRSHGYAI